MKIHSSLQVIYFITTYTILTSCNTDSDSPPVFNPPEQPVTASDAPEVYAWEPLLPEDDAMVLRETTTGSIFNLRGEALSGPLSDEKRRLVPVPGITTYWFSWSIFFPGSALWGVDGTVRAAAIPNNRGGIQSCYDGLDCVKSLPNVGPPKGDLNWLPPALQPPAYLDDSDIVIGVFLNGAPRAYPLKILWRHQVANDYVGNTHFTVTYCPLSGAGMVFDTSDIDRTFGVSGFLFNANLVLYDHQGGSTWSQLSAAAVTGSAYQNGDLLTLLPSVETTYATWRTLYPDTFVMSSNTGFDEDYDTYPYAEYAADNGDTFIDTEPEPDDRYPNKSLVFGLFHREPEQARAYVYDELDKQLDRQGILEDTFDAAPIIVVYDLDAHYITAYHTETEDGVLLFEPEIYGNIRE